MLAQGRKLPHHKIPLTKGFYGMLCHETGAPEAEWDTMTRLINAAPDMRNALRSAVLLLDAYARDVQRDLPATSKAVQQRANSFRVLLAVIDGPPVNTRTDDDVRDDLRSLREDA